jgi:hypothetical protein
MKDKKELAEILAVASEVYEKQISNVLLEIYFLLLKSYTIKEIKTAVMEHLKDQKYGQFFPKPADIIRKMDIKKERLYPCSICHQNKTKKEMIAFCEDRNVCRDCRSLGQG